MPPGPAPSWSGQPLSLRPEPAAVREELPAAIWGASAGSLRAACGEHGRRLHLRRSVRRAGTSRQRPEAEGSGAHCRGPRLSARTRLQGAASGGGELSTAQSLTTKGHLKRKARSNPPTPGLRAHIPCHILPRVSPQPNTAPSDSQSPPGERLRDERGSLLSLRPKRQTLSRPGPEEELVGGGRCGDVGRVRPVGLFSRVPLRENLRTASA